MLYALTIFVNFASVIIAVWLGLYLVTRNPRNQIAWMTGITLWLIGGLFVNILFALNPPIIPADRPFWLQLILIFWMGPATSGGENSWLMGWSIAFGIVIWHHTTTLLRGPLNGWRKIRIAVGYLIAGIAVLLRLYTPLLYAKDVGDPLYLNSLVGGPLYPLFGAWILIFTGWSFVNLLRSARHANSIMLRKQLETLATATLVATLAAPVAIAGSWFDIRIPIVAVSLPLGISVSMVGYGVARYSALVEGRIMRRDFFYSAVFLVGLVFIFLLGTWMLLQVYQLPPVIYVVVVLMAIVTQSLYGVGEFWLDKFIYQRDTITLRNNLRQLNHLATEQEDLQERLTLALESMCLTVRATYGILLVQEQNTFTPLATHNWSQAIGILTRTELGADDALHLPSNHFPAPLHEAALLIPLYTDTDQMGALILGRPVNGLRYSDRDLAQLLDASDRISSALRHARLEQEHLKQINALAQASAPKTEFTPEKISTAVVEKALRNLKDYAVLGDSPLANLRTVNAQFKDGSVTHVDRGKVVCTLLTNAMEKLRPEGKEPGDLAPREWHPYLVLHDAYIKDRLNRDIMGRLYISEGTFNRTRRSALRSIARILEEMEKSGE